MALVLVLVIGCDNFCAVVVVSLLAPWQSFIAMRCKEKVDRPLHPAQEQSTARSCHTTPSSSLCSQWLEAYLSGNRANANR